VHGDDAYASVMPLYGPTLAQEGRSGMGEGVDSRPRLIGIGGASGAGKDVVASYLVDHCGYTRLGFADALKEEVLTKFKGTLIAHLLDIGWLYPSDTPDIVQQGLHEIVWRHRTPLVRCLLQEMGTEVRRADDPGYWVKRWSRRWQQLKATTYVVVPDVRFENECAALREQGGILVRVTRPESSLSHISKAHKSEQMAFRDSVWDVTLQNNTTLHEFQSDIIEIWAKTLVGEQQFLRSSPSV